MSLVLRKAALGDSRFLWLWRNDETTRRNSRTTDPIPWDHHNAWYTAALKDPRRIILIALEGQAPAGMIRLDQEEADRFTINILVAPASRGRGLGHIVLGAGCEYLRMLHPRAELRATVKADNVPSQRIFEANGFRRDGLEDEPGFFHYRRIPES
jgi:RimJ/RimL family protein N-acetyltransferase